MGEVLSAQRMLREEVDVVCDYHQVADLELRVHASRSVAYKESLYAEFVHYAYRERNFLHVVAFIIVEASFHSHYVNVAELAENQFAGVSLHRRNGEVRYFRVRKLVAVSDF